MEEPTQEQIKEAEKTQALIRKLSHSEEFKAWRNGYVQPEIDRLEYEINRTSDQMDETILRSNLKYLNALKYFFKVVFEEADFKE